MVVVVAVVVVVLVVVVLVVVVLVVLVLVVLGAGRRGEESCVVTWAGVSSLRYIAASLIEPENMPLGWSGHPFGAPPSCQ